MNRTPGGLLQRDVPLDRLNTFGLPARAVGFAAIETPAQLTALRALPEWRSWPRFVLGGGSNLVLTGDFAGLVLQVRIPGRQLVAEDAEAWWVQAGAGENWHDFVIWTLDCGWPGLENLALIPGTVGAAPIQNIGAYGLEMAERFQQLAAVDLETGKSEVLYRNCGKLQLRGPNDIVFDKEGGFWFTDPGRIERGKRDRGCVYYAKTDGSYIKRVIFPMEGANGIGLSPDDKLLYVADSPAGRIWSFEIEAPGEIRRIKGPVPWERGHFVGGTNTYSVFDSLAIDADGNICVSNIPHGGITVMAPDGRIIEEHPMPDIFTTNIAFGGKDLKTAYITLSSSGQLVAMDFPRPGLPLYWLNR